MMWSGKSRHSCQDGEYPHGTPPTSTIICPDCTVGDDGKDGLVPKSLKNIVFDYGYLLDNDGSLYKTRSD
ncbi:MAG: hypothetical protein OXC91_01285 [Rhodobacteraceae bacterium]|nr:hypothetical protein [Paracoccaceae bacterium]